PARSSVSRRPAVARAGRARGVRRRPGAQARPGLALATARAGHRPRTARLPRIRDEPRSGWSLCAPCAVGILDLRWIAGAGEDKQTVPQHQRVSFRDTDLACQRGCRIDQALVVDPPAIWEAKIAGVVEDRQP